MQTAVLENVLEEVKSLVKRETRTVPYVHLARVGGVLGRGSRATLSKLNISLRCFVSLHDDVFQLQGARGSETVYLKDAAPRNGSKQRADLATLEAELRALLEAIAEPTMILSSLGWLVSDQGREILRTYGLRLKTFLLSTPAFVLETERGGIWVARLATPSEAVSHRTTMANGNPPAQENGDARESAREKDMPTDVEESLLRLFRSREEGMHFLQSTGHLHAPDWAQEEYNGKGKGKPSRTQERHGNGYMFDPQDQEVTREWIPSREQEWHDSSSSSTPTQRSDFMRRDRSTSAEYARTEAMWAEQMAAKARDSYGRHLARERFTHPGSSDGWGKGPSRPERSDMIHDYPRVRERYPHDMSEWDGWKPSGRNGHYADRKEWTDDELWAKGKETWAMPSKCGHRDAPSVTEWSRPSWRVEEWSRGQTAY